MEKHSAVRDSWGSKWGFILACIGSAVGMGNIWLFPARVSQYGGATFLIPYLIFVVIIGSTGVIGEVAFGRATRIIGLHTYSQSPHRNYDIRLTGNWVERGGFRFEDFVLTRRKEENDGND